MVTLEERLEELQPVMDEYEDLQAELDAIDMALYLQYLEAEGIVSVDTYNGEPMIFFEEGGIFIDLPTDA